MHFKVSDLETALERRKAKALLDGDEIRNAKDERKKAEATSNDARTALVKKEVELAEVRFEKRQTDKDLEDVQGKLEKEQRGYGELEKKLAEKDQLLADVRKMLEATEAERDELKMEMAEMKEKEDEDVKRREDRGGEGEG